MTSHQVQLLFLDVALILALARGLGALAARIGQPPVVGEILGGILLGPTLFGGFFADHLFPSDVRPLLTALADVGVALFMFVVGLELEHRVLRGRTRVSAGAALGSTLVPFVLGVGLALWLLRDHDTEQRTAFIVFMGLAVSVTAFPVLARILADRGLSRTEIGGIALATAALVDVVAWSALAGVQAVVGGADDYWRVTLLVPFTALLVALRPVLRRLLGSGGSGGSGGAGKAGAAGSPTRLSANRFGVVLVGALLSAAATEAMGMHYIFGAFLFGAVLPRDAAGALRDEVCERTGHVTSLLLPVYFVVAGLKVDLRGVGLNGLLELAVIILVAVAGKFLGTYAGARSQGLSPHSSGRLAALMNTRGLTELVILGVGLQLGLLEQSLYSLMVVMALVTTAMTGPVLTLLDRRGKRLGIPAAAADTAYVASAPPATSAASAVAAPEAKSTAHAHAERETARS
ncbi:cation:proton antiporter [Streptomyces lasiicapitis]|uniref:Integral membrane ion exchanger n=1 Tax=Streptomyces lasiicapitis TaxID=1923961 RepID=A0ABQ2LJJ7_9ACTN|nr:cation:proton antiporter [Streptomyces lasiicapitis]GGO36705.1 integral membrane ion exchanger [Streptomyces lasiicapitis]